MASHDEIESKKNECQQLEGEPTLDRIAQQVRNLSKLKIIYDQID